MRCSLDSVGTRFTRATIESSYVAVALTSIFLAGFPIIGVAWCDAPRSGAAGDILEPNALLQGASVVVRRSVQCLLRCLIFLHAPPFDSIYLCVFYLVIYLRLPSIYAPEYSVYICASLISTDALYLHLCRWIVRP